MNSAASAAAAAVLVAGFAGLGCDEPIKPPVIVQPVTPADVTPVRATTQELLEGPRKSVGLGELPLTVQAPSGWSVKPLQGTTQVLLQGPTPSGEAFIQLNVRPTTPAAKFDVIVSGAKKELQQFPQSIKLVELREIPGAKVLERQRVGQPPRPSPDDPPDVKLSAPINWTIFVFVPRGAEYETYELNFVGLTADQYEADKPVLRGIVESIAVAGAGPVEGATIPRPAAATTVPAAL